MKQLLLFLLISFSITSVRAQYCTSSASSADEEWISFVRLNTGSHYSGTSSGYADFTGISDPMNIVVGSCHNINVNVDYSGTAYAEYYGVWIDLNQDNDFFDPGEEIYKSYSPSVGGFGFNFDISPNAVTGATRMRIVMKYGSVATPCGSFSYGEVEDYTVHILASDPVCVSRGLNTSYEYIDAVDINGTNINSGDNNGYYKENCSGAYLNMGMVNVLNFLPGFQGGSYPEVWKMWIDYNKNDSFEDAGELVLTSSPNEGIETFSLLLPNSLNPYDIYRVRVAMKYGSGSANSCATFFYGEVEDYMVVVLDPLGVAGTLQAETITRASSQGNEVLQTRFAVSPNPATDYIQVGFEFERDIPESIQILNLQGQLVKEIRNNVRDSNRRIDISTLQEGYYILQCKVSEEIEAVPFVVVR